MVPISTEGFHAESGQEEYADKAGGSPLLAHRAVFERRENIGPHEFRTDGGEALRLEAFIGELLPDVVTVTVVPGDRINAPHVARRFYLERHRDVTEVHDPGVIAYGVVFGDGTTVLRWRPGKSGGEGSVAVWPRLADALATHMHPQSQTDFVWVD